MRILIVRHAEPDYTVDGLTEKGRREAELLAARLAAIPAKAYYVSPLGRARETAGYTLRRVGREAEVLPWLAEFRGRTVDAETGRSRIPWDYRADQWADHPLLYDPARWTEDALVREGDTDAIWRETAQGVDALLAAHGYTREGLLYRCPRNTEDTLVLFCHYGVGMAVMAYLLGLPTLPMWQGFLFFPSAVTTLVTQERQPGLCAFRCVAAGDVSHLLAAGEQPSLAGLFPECWNGVDSTDPALWPAPPENPVLR